MIMKGFPRFQLSKKEDVRNHRFSISIMLFMPLVLFRISDMYRTHVYNTKHCKCEMKSEMQVCRMLVETKKLWEREAHKCADAKCRYWQVRPATMAAMQIVLLVN